MAGRGQELSEVFLMNTNQFTGLLHPYAVRLPQRPYLLILLLWRRLSDVNYFWGRQKSATGICLPQQLMKVTRGLQLNNSLSMTSVH